MKETGCRLSFGDLGRKYVLGVDVDENSEEEILVSIIEILQEVFWFVDCEL